MNLSVKEIGPTETAGSIVFAPRSRKLVSIRCYNPDFLTVPPHGSEKVQLLQDFNLVLAFPDPTFGKTRDAVPT